MSHDKTDDTPPQQVETCQHCGNKDALLHKVYCRKCDLKGTILFSQRSDGTYVCSLCTLAGNPTDIERGCEGQHVEDEHGFEWGDTKATIKEHERISAIKKRSSNQGSIREFA